VAGVFFIGGNVDGAGGNSADCGGPNNLAECNALMDVSAVDEVLRSGLKLHVLDAVSVRSLPVPVELPLRLTERLQHDPSPIQQFLVETLRVFLGTATHQLYFYDPAAAVWRHLHAVAARHRAADRAPPWESWIPQGRWAWRGGADFCLLRRSPRLSVVTDASPLYGTLVPDRAASTVDLCRLPSSEEFAASFFRPFIGGEAAAHIRLAAGQWHVPPFDAGCWHLAALLTASVSGALIFLLAAKARPRQSSPRILASPLLQ